MDQRERERERPRLFILIFTETFTTRSRARLARVADRRYTRSRTHTHTQRQRRRGGASAGHAAPADRGSPSLRKNSKRWSRRGGSSSLHLSRPSWLQRSPASSHAADKKRKKREKERKETTNPRQTLDSVNPRPKWYTLLTQNGQPLYMWPSLPFIDQGGWHLTTWDLFPREPSYPPFVCIRCTAPICSPPSSFRLWPKIFTTTVRFILLQPRTGETF